MVKEKTQESKKRIGAASGLAISRARLDEVNALLSDAAEPLVSDLVKLVERYGGPAEVRRRAAESGSVESLVGRLQDKGLTQAEGVEWLAEQKRRGAFTTVEGFRRRVLGGRAGSVRPDERNPVTLEISALQYFPFLLAEARQAIGRGELMPGRFIRVRNMKEQEGDGDLLAVSAAMRIVGASWCETLDTKGTDGSNVHLGGPDTITGYFGGVGQPNRHALQWAEEFMHYHTNYGVRQVLNVNSGTILAGYLLYKLGVDIEFKISVFMGNDNPYAVLWTLMAARLLAREDGTTPLVGFNFSNSVDNDTIRACSRVRERLGLAGNVRFEHHVLETWKSIVRQPYDRRGELAELARDVPNISAKHEGGEVAVERARSHPSDILDYFMPREKVEAEGLMPLMERNYLDKHDAVNETARELVRAGLGFVAARGLHS